MPENDAAADGEIMGRCNALHDWLMMEAMDGKFFSSGMTMAAYIMGFEDVIREIRRVDAEQAKDEE